MSILLLASAFSAHAGDRYHLSFSADLASVAVQACFDGAAPQALHRHDRAWRFTTLIEGPGGANWPDTQSRRLELDGLEQDSCMRWQVDLAAAVAQNDYRLALELEGAVLSDANLWFWRDDERREIRVTADLPEGMSLSAPWQQSADDNGTVFRPLPTPAGWSSRTAVGRFEIQRLHVPGAQLRLAVIGKVTNTQRAMFAEWIRENAECVASVEGRFPQPSPQILVVAVGAQREAVPWAHVIRGGGVAAEFFVDQNRNWQEFHTDWTAAHELSHMLLPLVSYRDRWLSEGVASYYQNVLRGRDGRLDETDAWRKLHAGFERGKRATRPESLARATRSGRNATMRVYWSGAAMLLKADTRLRILSDGAQSLDTALAELQACCLDETRVWRARDIFTELDRITGYSIFTELYRQHVPDHEFPGLEETYTELGLVAGDGYFRLNPSAPRAEIRQAIMQGSAP